MIVGFANDLRGKIADSLTIILADKPWKRTVRNVYAFLSILTIILFTFTFFMPGIAFVE